LMMSAKRRKSKNGPYSERHSRSAKLTGKGQRSGYVQTRSAR
jgi:hypothetical protein